METLLLACAAGWILAALTPRRGAAGGPARQRSARMDRSLRVQCNYLIYLPPDYQQREAWPLLLFLHGAGERGQDLESVKQHGPPRRIEAGHDFPFVVVSPQCPAGEAWQPLPLMALLDEIVSTCRIDEDRIWVTGLSMGGFGTWALACHAPRRFAAIAPVCGGGETFRAENLAHLPVWVFHGAQDDVVPLQRSREMVEALQGLGGDVRFSVYAEAGHDSWTETYDNPALYEWLQAQSRRPVAEP